MAIKTVGVVGCGLMGSGIVEVCAKSGYDVIVMEMNDGLLKRGLERIDASLAKAVERKKLDAAARDGIRARIRGTTGFADFRDADFVVEAAIENLDEKKQIFAQLDTVTRPDATLSSNTSSLSIIDMASATKRPAQVLGMHFFNPVPVMPLLEMVRSFLTSEATYQAARAFGESLGKTVVVAKDKPGFIVNALLIPYLLDAIRMVEEGAASREDIDAGIHLGLNHPMGPLTLTDFVGLDTTLYVADAMFAETKNARYAAPTLLRRMVTAGHMGRKSGKGFYEYE
ncbi:MAG: 3-hydroxybutyryl-CoA dehydrogenase [Chloroflexi bacterium]|nr:3-hydroxybutyryl-CoA dehydrogenase [Chloroflexota bacterium]